MSVGPQARGVVSLRLAGESLEEQGGTPALLVLKERRLQVYIEAVAGAGFGDDCRMAADIAVSKLGVAARPTQTDSFTLSVGSNELLCTAQGEGARNDWLAIFRGLGMAVDAGEAGSKTAGRCCKQSDVCCEGKSHEASARDFSELWHFSDFTDVEGSSRDFSDIGNLNEQLVSKGPCPLTHSGSSSSRRSSSSLSTIPEHTDLDLSDPDMRNSSSHVDPDYVPCDTRSRSPSEGDGPSDNHEAKWQEKHEREDPLSPSSHLRHEYRNVLALQKMRHELDLMQDKPTDRAQTTDVSCLRFSTAFRRIPAFVLVDILED